LVESFSHFLSELAGADHLAQERRRAKLLADLTMEVL